MLASPEVVRPTSDSPDNIPNSPGKREHDHLGLQERPAGALDRARIAAGAAQHRAMGRAHQPEMDDRRERKQRVDRERHEWSLPGHHRAQPFRRLAARRRQDEDRQAEPDERHAECHDDGRQVPEVDQRADRGIDQYAAGKRRDPEQRLVGEPGRADAGDEADIGTERQVEVVHGDDEHLGDGRKRDRQREIEQEVEADIAHRARLHPEHSEQDDDEGQRWQQDARVAGQECDRASGGGLE